MSEGKIVAVADGATGWLIFSNPERLNAVSYEMWRAIPERIAELVGENAIRAVVLRGEGIWPSFPERTSLSLKRSAVPRPASPTTMTQLASPTRQFLRARSRRLR